MPSMNDRLNSDPADASGDPPAVEAIDAALPRGLQLGGFEIQRVLARSASTVVYLATDHALAIPVALQEYLPARLARRDAGLQLRAIEPRNEDVIARGRRVFIDESRMLARCDHPALVRVTQLFEALCSAYRVMPVYAGQRLTELRSAMVGAPDEAALRALLDPLLGAVETIHRAGQVHGGITPTNILLRPDDRPLLLAPGGAALEVGSDLVDALMATLDRSAAAKPADGFAAAPPTGVARDLYMLADTLRFCITGEAPAPAGTLHTREPLAAALVRRFADGSRPTYSAALLATLDATLSPFAEDRPLTAAQFRDWLARGVPGGAIRVAPIAVTVPAPAPVAVEPAPPAAASAAAGRAAHAAPPPDAPRSIPPWPEPAIGLTDDPITPERPPWIPPPLPPQLQRVTTTQARRRHTLIAAAGTGLVVVAIAAIAVWWNITPEIRMEPVAGRATPPRIEAAPTPAAATPSPMEAAATTQPPSAAPPSTTVSSSPVAPPTASEPAPEPAATAKTDAAQTIGASAAVEAPATVATESSTSPAAPGTNTSARPVRGSTAAPPGGPRTACADRTEFALYRCMQQQCELKRWAMHTQCIRLRLDDRVD
jgi:serine/threonine protein kinase